MNILGSGRSRDFENVELQQGGRGSSRLTLQVVGCAHSGCGFGSARIADHARQVARERAAVSKMQREAVAQTPLASPLAIGREAAVASRFGGAVTRRPSRLESVRPEEPSLRPGRPGLRPMPNVMADFTHDSSDRNAALMMGSRPSAWSVVLGVAVDASLSFALLAACHLAVANGGLDRLVTQSLGARLLDGQSLGKGVLPVRVEAWLALGDQAAATALLQPWIHGALVAICWMAVLGMLQFFCVSAFRATLGRALVGITINPVASRSKGLLALPLAEVLTFGGLLSLPFAILKPDRMVLVPGVRFKS
jgi:hypothetical protein